MQKKTSHTKKVTAKIRIPRQQRPGASTLDKDILDKLLKEAHEDAKNREAKRIAFHEEPLDRKIEELESTAAKLHLAINAMVEVCQNPRRSGQLGAACDEFEGVVKSFAKIVLAERIRRSFIGKIDPHTSKSTESLDEKFQHATEIREMLAPWNLGFAMKSGAAQIYGFNNGGIQGCFRMMTLGGKTAVQPTSRWEEIRDIVQNPHLVDVTDLMHVGSLKQR